MTEIYTLTRGQSLWNEVIKLAENCSWRVAGSYLARNMREKKYLPWERVFAAYVDGKIAGFCTLAEKDELQGEHDFTPFIGFVFVDEQYRGRRLSEKMIKTATDYAREIGFNKVYILSGEVGLYEKYGFQKLGDYPTTYGTVDQLFMKTTTR